MPHRETPLPTTTTLTDISKAEEAEGRKGARNHIHVEYPLFFRLKTAILSFNLFFLKQAFEKNI